MNGDGVRRLAAAVERVREYERAGEQVELLGRQVAEAERRVAALGRAHERERRDVARLERASLTRLVAALRGTREEDLLRERTEAQRAGQREAQERARLAALRDGRRAAEARRAELADAPRAYAALLDERERQLTADRDPRAARLTELTAERGRLTARSGQLDRARRTAGAALTALGAARDQLARADAWSTYDTFLGGGAVSSVVKHGRMDDAAAAARAADRQLAALRTELAELAGWWLAPQLELDGLTRFTDIFLDNIFTDLAVRGRIRKARASVDRAAATVTGLRDRLAGEADETARRLAALAVERVTLLTAP
ncbi:hypothetical protein [Micromonospora auratinigra]|uniref:hypothetical protein n=1 Tax=Micromonospora auratinigra TaxID=261654 RepID=UPI0012FDFCCA|nr:hypothetical protein [Micromonospora auratinigra]